MNDEGISAKQIQLPEEKKPVNKPHYKAMFYEQKRSTKLWKLTAYFWFACWVITAILLYF